MLDQQRRDQIGFNDIYRRRQDICLQVIHLLDAHTRRTTDADGIDVEPGDQRRQQDGYQDDEAAKAAPLGQAQLCFSRCPPSL